MRRFSTVVLVVLGLSIVALLATVAGLGGIAYLKYRDSSSQAQAALKQAQAVAKQVEDANARVAQALEAAQTPGAQKPKAPRRPRTRPATAAAEDSTLEDSPAEEQQEPEVKVVTSEDGSVVTVTQTKPGEYHMTGTFSASGEQGLGLSGLSGTWRLKTMSLTEAQKASIEAYNRQFEPTVKQANEEGQRAVREAFRQVTEAQKGQDQQVLAAAQKQVQEAMDQCAQTRDELNKQYCEGVKPYLTPEQVAELDKAAQQPAPAAAGVIMMQADGQKPTVIVVPLSEGEGGTAPNSETPGP